MEDYGQQRLNFYTAYKRNDKNSTSKNRKGY